MGCLALNLHPFDGLFEGEEPVGVDREVFNHLAIRHASGVEIEAEGR